LPTAIAKLLHSGFGLYCTWLAVCTLLVRVQEKPAVRGHGHSSEQTYGSPPIGRRHNVQSETPEKPPGNNDKQQSNTTRGNTPVENSSGPRLTSVHRKCGQRPFAPSCQRCTRIPILEPSTSPGLTLKHLPAVHADARATCSYHKGTARGDVASAAYIPIIGFANTEARKPAFDSRAL
jgi:hypothetical protein